MGFFDEEVDSDSGNGVDVVMRVDSAALHDAIIACVRRGWLVSIGGSRDGFSVSLSLYGDGKQLARKYYTELERLCEALGSIEEAAKAPPQAKGPKGSRKRS